MIRRSKRMQNFVGNSIIEPIKPQSLCNISWHIFWIGLGLRGEWRGVRSRSEFRKSDVGHLAKCPNMTFLGLLWEVCFQEEGEINFLPKYLRKNIWILGIMAWNCTRKQLFPQICLKTHFNCRYINLEHKWSLKPL